MSAATIEAVGMPRPTRVRPSRRPAQRTDRTRPAAPVMPARESLGMGAAAVSARSCEVAVPVRAHAQAMAAPRLSDRTLLAMMVGLGLLFLVGLGVLVQGFWQISSGAEAEPYSAPAIHAQR